MACVRSRISRSSGERAPRNLDEHEQAGEQPPPARITAAEGARAADSKPAAPKSLYDSLEKEMASLLGRPNSKT